LIKLAYIINFKENGIFRVTKSAFVAQPTLIWSAPFQSLSCYIFIKCLYASEQ